MVNMLVGQLINIQLLSLLDHHLRFALIPGYQSCSYDVLSEEIAMRSPAVSACDLSRNHQGEILLRILAPEE